MKEVINKVKRLIPKSFSPNHWKKESRKIIFRHEVINFTKAFKQNFVTLMISSLGLLVALTWNEFWKGWVSSLSTENTLSYKFLVAIGTTLFAVILTYFFSKLKD